MCAGVLAQPVPSGGSAPGPLRVLQRIGRLLRGLRGPGINVVLLHDGLQHSISWQDVWAPLCSNYHVMRYDRRGYGRSAAAHAPFAPEDDLFSLMRLLKMNRTILVGNSSRAGLALDFALARPDMTEGLFLIGPVVHGVPRSGYFLERGAAANAPPAKNDVEAAAENGSRDKFLIAGPAPDLRKKISQGAGRQATNSEDRRSVRDSSISDYRAPTEPYPGARGGACGRI